MAVPSRIPHRISKILFALGANEFLVMLEGKIREGPFFKVQSGKKTVWYTFAIRELFYKHDISKLEFTHSFSYKKK